MAPLPKIDDDIFNDQVSCETSTPLTDAVKRSDVGLVRKNLSFATSKQCNLSFGTTNQRNLNFATPKQGSLSFATLTKGNLSFATSKENNLSFVTSRHRNLSTGDLSLKRPANRDKQEDRQLKRVSSGDIRHSSDTTLYSSASLSRMNQSTTTSRGSLKNAEFSFQAGTSLCLAQRAGAGGIRALIKTIIDKSPEIDVPPTEKPEAKDPCTEESAAVSKTDVDEKPATAYVPVKDDATNEQHYNPPIPECNVISRWATEPYYRVVITSSGGIPAIIRAMRVHSNSADLQIAGCTAFSNLCTGSVSNQKAVLSEGGLDAIRCAAKLHPNDEAVLNAARNVLRILNAEIDAQ